MLAQTSKLLRRRRRRNNNLPPFSLSSLRRHSTAVAESPSNDAVSSIVIQFQELLQHPKDQWNSHNNNTKLLTLLFNDSTTSLSSEQLLQITRQLGSPSKAIDFLEFLRANAKSQEFPFASSVFQGALELANRSLSSRNEVLKLHSYRKTLNWDIPLTAESSVILLKCFEGALMVEDSVSLFRELDPSLKSSRICNWVFRVLWKSGRIDDALQVLDEMLESDSQFPPNGSTGEIIFDELVKREQPGRRVSDEEIVGLVKKLGERGVFPDTFRLTQLVTKLCKRRNKSAAWEVLHCVMELGGKVEAASCNALLTGLGKCRDIEGMNKLLAKMKEMNISPSVVTFGIIIRHMCEARRVDAALEVFSKLRGEGVGSNEISVEPDVILFNTLIDGLCKAGREEEGLSLLNDMKTRSKHRPNTVTYNCIIDGFCKAGNIDKARELFDQMNEEGVQPNAVTLNVMVNGLCRLGRVHSAVEFFDTMKGKGLRGNAATYTALISAFCGVNNIDKAMQVFDEMLSSGCSPDAIVYYSLISGLSIAGRMDDASIVVSKLKQAGFGLDVVCYNVLISGFCKKKKIERVYELLGEMEKSGVKPDIVTYNTLLAYLGKSGDFATANNLMNNMSKEGLSPSVVTYGALIHAHCLKNNVDEAMKIFKEMCSTKSKVPPNTVIYNTLIDALCKNNDVEGAISLMVDMKVRGVRPNTTTYNAILKGVHDKRMLDVAFVLMDRMIEDACSPNYVTMEILTEWLPEVGESEKLKQFVEGYPVSSGKMPPTASHCCQLLATAGHHLPLLAATANVRPPPLADATSL